MFQATLQFTDKKIKAQKGFVYTQQDDNWTVIWFHLCLIPKVTGFKTWFGGTSQIS